MFSDKLVTTDARQIAVTKVDKNSPADGILRVGDVILGAGGKPFSYDPRTELGKAITAAETAAGGGNLSLIRWRAGKTEQVVVKLPVLGTYSATAPYDCPKSQRILRQGCKALARRIADPSYRENPITRSLNALALLAGGNPQYLPLVRKEAHWAANFSADSFQTWYYGYVITMLAEYTAATGDDSVMPGLRRLSLEAANGQSIVGSWGHRFAQPDGRLGGYGMMNSPGLPLTIGLILSRKAGVDDPKVSEAIEKSARLIRFYIGKGAVPYGDHHPWTQTHDDNGKCGMAAVMFNLLGEANGAEFFSRMSVASHGPERDTGHTGNFFNILWSLPGVAQSGPHATRNHRRNLSLATPSASSNQDSFPPPALPGFIGTTSPSVTRLRPCASSARWPSRTWPPQAGFPCCSSLLVDMPSPTTPAKRIGPSSTLVRFVPAFPQSR